MCHLPCKLHSRPICRERNLGFEHSTIQAEHSHWSVPIAAMSHRQRIHHRLTRHHVYNGIDDLWPVLDFVNILLEKCDANANVHALAHYLSELVLQDGQYASTKPSLVATAVVLYARLCSNGNNLAAAWDADMRKACRYTTKDVLRYVQVNLCICFGTLHNALSFVVVYPLPMRAQGISDIHRHIRFSTLTVIREYYQLPSQYCVANVPSLPHSAFARFDD